MSDSRLTQRVPDGSAGALLGRRSNKGEADAREEIFGPRGSGSASGLQRRQGEFEVLRALGSGMLVKDVAAQLHLSAKTVSTYRARLLEKMGLKSKADLVRYVATHELLK